MKTGRPKGPEKKLYRKRLTAEQVLSVERLLEATNVGSVTDDKEFVKLVNDCRDAGYDVTRDKKVAESFESARNEVIKSEANTQIRALLDDVGRLSEELEAEKAKVKRALDMDLDAKGKLGWKLYFQLKEGNGKSEHDQT